MDDRDRRQIEVGAGLQESRLNTELIEWLQKWGPRVLYVLLAVVLGYLGWNKWQIYRQNQLDKAFAEYHAEQSSQNPDVLLAVAKKQDGKGSIWTLATLDASDLLLTAGRLGVPAGVGANAAADAEMLTPEERTNVFRSALEHYQAVLDRNKNDAHHARFAQKARWGIISTRLSLGEVDEARKVLEQYIAVAEKYGFTDNLALGKHRMEVLKNVAEPIPVYTAAQLPEENRPLVQNFGAGTGTIGPASIGPGTPASQVPQLRRLSTEEGRARVKGEAPDANTPAPSDTPDTPQEPSADPGADPE